MSLYRTFCVGIAFFVVHIRKQLLVADSNRVVARFDLWSHVPCGVHLRRQSVSWRNDHYDAELDASKLGWVSCRLGPNRDLSKNTIFLLRVFISASRRVSVVSLGAQSWKRLRTIFFSSSISRVALLLLAPFFTRYMFSCIHSTPTQLPVNIPTCHNCLKIVVADEDGGN